MDLQLHGKRALITGSSVGIGEAAARALAAEGATVAIHGRDRGRANLVAEAIGAAGGAAVVVVGDLTHADEVERLVEDVLHQLGGVDILVNNAGGSAEKHVWWETQASDWAAAYDRNVLAAVRITNGLIPGMRSGGWGRVVNVSSVAGVMPPAAGPDYSASKAALNNFTLSLARAVANSGITVNAVSPGTILTPKLEAAFRAMAGSNGWADPAAPWVDVERAVLPHIVRVPVGKVGHPDDVAHAIAFLCSPLASYITGVDLRVDGGAVPTS